MESAVVEGMEIQEGERTIIQRATNLDLRYGATIKNPEWRRLKAYCAEHSVLWLNTLLDGPSWLL